MWPGAMIISSIRSPTAIITVCKRIRRSDLNHGRTPAVLPDLENRWREAEETAPSPRRIEECLDIHEPLAYADRAFAGACDW